MLRRKRKWQRGSPRSILIKQILIGVVCFVSLGLIGYGVWYVSHLEALAIKTVEVTGGKTVEADTVREVASAELEGTYYKLVPKNFSWTYPEESIRQAVNDIARVKSVTIEEAGDNTILLTIEEYVPFALWCVVSDQGCYFIDTGGEAFAEAPDLSGTAFLRYVQSNDAPKLGARLASPSMIASTAELAKNFNTDFDMTVSHIELIGEREVNFHLAKGGLLKTERLQEVQVVTDNLSTILNSEEFSHLRPGNFEYIDLRFGDKVFIKEVEEKENNPASTTSSTLIDDVVEEGA